MYSGLCLCIWLASNVVATSTPVNDYPIQPVPFTRVKVDAGFWGPRVETNRRVTVNTCLQRCGESGRLANFAKAGGRLEGGFEGIYFNDSDVFKVIEGAAYTLAGAPDPKLEAALDAIIADIALAQEDDGYLYTARTINDPKYDFPGKPARWSHLRGGHELYNVGHMYEAAVAHFQATGKRTLLDIAIKNADLIAKTFGPGPDQLHDVPGHEEIEIGLVKLYRATGEQRYLDLAKYFLDQRGNQTSRGELYGEYWQDHLPVTEQAEAVGHAVRAGYLYSGMADVAALTGDAAYRAALDRLWDDVVSHKLYLTGGIGARRQGEAFGDAYELPNRSAYAETCAAIANALWNHRMFLLTGDGQYIDVLERVIYNGFLSGVSLAGDTFFYPNPLEHDGDSKFNMGASGRSPWFNCSCCPVNVVRFVPSIAGLAYAVRDDVAYVNLYFNGTAKLQVDGQSLDIQQRTQYPWDGSIRLELQLEQPTEFGLRLRIPGWARGKPVPSDLYRYADAESTPIELTVNNAPVGIEVHDGYAVLRREWQPGDRVELHLPLPIRRVLCHHQVAANRGRVALERGPLVYCVEGADHDGRALNLVLPDDAGLSSTHRADLLGGVTVIQGEALAVTGFDRGYPVMQPRPLTAIPYYAWCHRGPGEMAVWLPRTPGGIPRPPLAAAFEVSASHCFEKDTLAAVNDGLEPATSGDHAIPRMTWWPRRGATEWLQYDLPEPRRLTAVEVYWFDDTGHGACRVPQSWRLLRRSDDEWRPVATSGELGVKKDTWNRVEFAPLETDGLRIEVSLRTGFSGGVLEWRVE